MPLIQALNDFFKPCFDFDLEESSIPLGGTAFFGSKIPKSPKQIKAISPMDNDLEKLYGVANGPDNHQCDRP